MVSDDDSVRDSARETLVKCIGGNKFCYVGVYCCLYGKLAIYKAVYLWYIHEEKLTEKKEELTQCLRK